jgi:hypothetical protein
MDAKQDAMSRGQAINLAVNIAIKEGKANDSKYIVQQFVRMYELILALQTNKLETIKEQSK